MTTLTVMPTEYVVTCAPRWSINAGPWTIRVVERGPDRWAVSLRGIWCLSDTGNWDEEPLPSERDDAWKTAHRFDLNTALRLAKEAAPAIVAGVVGRGVVTAAEAAEAGWFDDEEAP